MTHTEPSLQVLGEQSCPSRPTSPGFNQPSITHCLLLLTAHLLALVKHVVNK